MRRALHAAGARFRLQRKIAPGCTPDLVLPGRRIAVFVDGDFWHGCPTHNANDRFSGPNARLWREKIARNRERDAVATAAAQAAGWTVVRVWECEVEADAGSVAGRVLAAAARLPR